MKVLRFILEVLSEKCDRRSLLPPESSDVKNTFDSANKILDCISKCEPSYKKLKAIYVGNDFIIVNEDITKNQIEHYAKTTKNKFIGFSSMYSDEENDEQCNLWVNQEALVLLNEIAENYPEIKNEIDICNNADIN